MNNRSLSFLVMGAIGYCTTLVFSLILFNSQPVKATGMLYPRESETREVKSLDGIWNFVRSDPFKPAEGIRQKWFMDDLSKVKNVIPMPVPSSYNDITEDESIRDHVGTVWYDRKFFIPARWSEELRVWIRFGAVHYTAIVWINGEKVVQHEIGHLPFEAEITNKIKYGQENRVTVICDNVLTSTTVPQGTVQEVDSDNGTALLQTYTFDFFNYAGIHRSVFLYTTPVQYIEDVEIQTSVEKNVGIVNYKIICKYLDQDVPYIAVEIKDKRGNVVASAPQSSYLEGVIEIPNVNLWWPYLMHDEPGYLYNFEVILSTTASGTVDIYRLRFGVRTLKWNTTQFLINDKPIYFRGFGRHEDSDLRGKGLDWALITKDFNLLRWIGANAYRTSHYPYSEESMEFADENGIMIIDECPSVDADSYSQALLEKHKESLNQLVHRDKNHPSVIMWSIANEPRTQRAAADAYFGLVVNYTRSLDPTRPITAAIAVGSGQDLAAKYLDIISFNRYNAWYSFGGRLDLIVNKVVQEATGWHEKHKKPVLMSEYGADSLEGLHFLPAFIWSEEYQSAVFSHHFEAFDILRKKGFFIGEFVWNFADFKTAQSYTRVGGNKKGVFTRNRQPKSSAYLLRKRYHALAQDLDHSKLPQDLFNYVIDSDKWKKSV